MAAKISNEAVKAAYSIAKRVYEGATIRAGAIKNLQQKFSLNPSSAADMIDNVAHMLRGERYERKNNSFATRYFLEMIREEFGLDKLTNAISAVTKHLDYYEALPTGSKQPAIRSIVKDFREILHGNYETTNLEPDQQQAFSQHRQLLDQAGEFNPADLKDAREHTIAAIVRRQGQPVFRNHLLRLYQGRCAISGCSVQAVLEAAHIISYKGPQTNHPSNGLLLRADLHTLFDLGFLAVVGKTMTVIVAQVLQGTCYEEYAGKSLTIPTDKIGRPSPAALDEHRKLSKHSKWMGYYK